MQSAITPFWFSRLLEVMILCSLVILGLFGVEMMTGSDTADISGILPVTIPAAVLAGATIVASVIALIFRATRGGTLLAAMAFSLFAAASGLLIVSGGGLESPFLVLWILVIIFAGIFSPIGTVLALIAAHAYAAYLYFNTGLSRGDIVVFILAVELPAIISFMSWRRKSTKETAKDKAFNALAAELSSMASRSEIVINAITDGVLSIDRQGNIQLINPAAQAMLGWGKRDAMGLAYTSVIKLADDKGKPLDDTTHPISQTLRMNQPLVNDDINLVTEGGRLIAISLLTSPIGSQGEGVIVVFRDITQQRDEERQQAEFISTASHEMRTPVAAIEGYLGLALNPATATIDDKARTYLAKAHESAQHLGRLFQDLLDVSKADDGRLNNKPVVIDIIAFLAEQVSGFEQKARDKGLVLLFKPTMPAATAAVDRRLAPILYTYVDYDHLLEVTGNLIENAIKYTRQGSVTIDVSSDDSTLTISVKDTGIGIPAEDISHLFQKFYRVDNSDTREIGGTGLGLYLCRRLVESMNGRLWVESEYGKGSTFLVQFPRLSHEEAMAKLEDAALRDQEQATQAAFTSPAAATAQQPVHTMLQNPAPVATQPSDQSSSGQGLS